MTEARCPVCQARYRGRALCSRCGADLAPVQRVLVRAYRLREAARAALLAGALDDAVAHAAAALTLQQTAGGLRLFVLARWAATLAPTVR